MKKNLIKLLAVIVIAGQAQTTLSYDWGMFGQGTAHFFSKAYNNTIGDLSGYQQAGIAAGIATILVGGCGFFIYKKALSSNNYQSEKEAKNQASQDCENLKIETGKSKNPRIWGLTNNYNYTNENNQREYYQLKAYRLRNELATHISLDQYLHDKPMKKISRYTFYHDTRAMFYN
ncbi:MAG: hypothetical protein WC707_02955 [Candidatus Babeliaceae bacterium]|jgi:hypothetical protein